MQANVESAEVMVLDFSAVRDGVRWLAQKVFTRESISEAGLVVATLVVTGYLGSVLVKGIETYSMSGF